MAIKVITKTHYYDDFNHPDFGELILLLKNHSQWCFENGLKNAGNALWNAQLTLRDISQWKLDNVLRSVDEDVKIKYLDVGFDYKRPASDLLIELLEEHVEWCDENHMIHAGCCFALAKVYLHKIKGESSTGNHWMVEYANKQFDKKGW